MFPTLGPRLLTIARLIPDGAKVCDVGTDHGLLPAYLYLEGKVQSVCATDINERPLARAQECIDRYKADVRLFLCDGLDGIDKDSVDTVIIAGMGGEVISGIIDRCAFSRQESVTFILQPMTGADELRRYLAQNGFNTVSETPVCEHSKVWSVMVVRFDGAVRECDGITPLVGGITADTKEGALYIKKQYDRCRKCVGALKNAPERGAEYLRWQTACEQLKKLLEDKYGF